MLNRLLDSRYRIKKLIGEGGMASVYLAFDEKLQRNVAVKILHSHLCQDEEIRERFYFEAKALSKAEHPNIVNIYDFSGMKSKQLWIVTEVLHGMNLGQYVERFSGNRLNEIIAALIVLEVLKALDHAHQRGIIHRDIKPENIMLLHAGQVKLMDFGISKNLHTNEMTRPGAFMGSPSYMSPEQVRGKDIDHHSDIYSICVLFYEIITGVLPFIGDNTAEVVNKIMIGKYASPRHIVPSLDEYLCNFIAKGMNPSPDERFDNVREMISVLTRFLTAQGFEESHIELERYFKNPKGFLARLRGVGQKGQQRSASNAANTVAAHSASGRDRYPSTMEPEATRKVDFNTYSPPTGAILSSTKTKTRNNHEPPPPPAPTAKAHRHMVPKVPGLAHPRGAGVSNQAASQPLMPHRGAGQGQMNHQEGRIMRPRYSQPPVEPSFAQWLIGTVILGAIILVMLWTTIILILSFKPTSGEPEVTRESTVSTSMSVPKTPFRKDGQLVNKQKPKDKGKVERIDPKAVVKPLPEGRADVDEDLSASTVRLMGNAPTMATREVVERSSEAGSGVLKISCKPSALITINEKTYGGTDNPTNITNGIVLPAGKYQLRLARQGYRPYEQDVVVAEGETKMIDTKLAILRASVSFTMKSNRAPLNVTIRGIDPVTRTETRTIAEKITEIVLTEGKYSIEIEYRGQTIQRTVVLIPDSAFTLNANFKEAP